MGKYIAIIIALLGGTVFSQAPSFSDQFNQNMAGRLAELRDAAEYYINDLKANGHTLEKATRECRQLDDSHSAKSGCKTAIRLVIRYEAMQDLKAKLDESNEYMRPLNLVRETAQDLVCNKDEADEFSTDCLMREVAMSAYEEYKPSVPTTLVGGAYFGGGALAFWAVFSALFGIMGLPFRRR